MFDEMLAENSVVITADTQVSLVAFPSVFPDSTPLLRLTLVFDGPSIDSPYLGTLYQAVRSGYSIVSTLNTMTIFTFQENYIVGSNFVIQDYYNVKNLVETRGIICWSQSSCPVTLNALKGPVSAMTLNSDDGDEYVKHLDVSTDSQLKVYLGARREGNETNLIATYNSIQAKNNIPQKFNGLLMTYYLEEGTALVELAEDSNYTRWNDAISGRKGFISSMFYGQNNYYQDTYEVIQAMHLNETFMYNINITYLDTSNSAVLSISFQDEFGITDYSFSAENPVQNMSFSVMSSKMVVTYVTNGTVTSGFYLDFEIETPISSNQVPMSFFFVTFIFIFLHQLFVD
uniref:CUB-like domain-containing protein n=2 Tax=Caenorhabditis japonica TaxID=281687 RepID=A0A8R1DSQ6_CAEJA